MGIQVAEVTTTFPLTTDLKKSFVEIVKDISGLDKVELVEKINKDLIGGFVLKVNDKLLDDSISGKLRTLRLRFAQIFCQNILKSSKHNNNIMAQVRPDTAILRAAQCQN